MTARACVPCLLKERHEHCISCNRTAIAGGPLCYGCARPDPDRVRALEESEKTSQQRRRDWMISARSS